jgi:hypothetical protein
MRNLLILLLVLGMATAANATLQISVNGIPEPQDTEITLGPSEEAILDVWTDADIPSDTFIYWALVAPLEDATISGGIAVPPFDDFNLYSCTIYDGAVGTLGYPNPPGTEGVGGTIAAYSPTIIPAGTVIFDDIIFHCEGVPPGVPLKDAEILLTITSDFVNFDILDRVVIHQTPEPMTLGLLGLGGLGLIRRRRR